ncbi:MAG: site-specific DNA-methyltransferase, partial [Clostridia bacterium]|nr:site-specific DNA-methyltransferase [Clostridia bacterium]
GWMNPVLIDGEGNIIAGHGRVLAARKLGLEEVPCVLHDHLTETQRKAYVLADNKLALNAGWDEESLRLELSELGDLGFDLELTGFGLDEINDITAEKSEGLTDPDDVPDVPEEPVTVEGDVWVLGRHRLMCGDSTSIDAVETLMDGRKANMLHTDPPYGVDYEGVPNDHLKDAQLEAFLHDALSCAFTALAPGSNIYVWHADITALEFISAFRSAGFKQARPPTIQWVKPSLILSQGDYHSQNEPCLYGWKEGSGRVRVKDRTQTTLWKCDRTDEAKVHPTMKPVELCQRAIENSSEVNGIVLDLFGGSGSTLIACEKTARDCYMMELDPKYCDVIIKRYCDFTGKQATLEATGETFEEVR